MIIDEWNNRQSYATLLKYLTEGIEFADSLMEAPVGRYEAGHGIFALVQEGMTTDLDNNLMECHREYVDVQLVVNGIESIECADKMSLSLNTPYNKEMDVELFGGSGERKIVTSGQFYILFPQDVHKCCGMVDGTSCRYKKMVLKVPYQIQVLPELNFCNLGNVMDDRLKRSVNDNTTIPMLWQGLLEMKIPVRNQERTAKVYIPKNCPQGTMFVLLNVPEGEETLSFLYHSGWMEKADKEQLCLFVAEPGTNGWRSMDEEQDYLQACYDAEKQGVYFRAGLCMYVVGYGRIGAGLHNLVIKNPLSFAAAVFMDADDVDLSLLTEYRDKIYGDDQRTYNVKYGEISVPIWLLSRSTTPIMDVVEYWKNAGSVGQGVDEELYGTVYAQEEETSFTPEGNIIKVAVKEGELEYKRPDTTEKILNFLLQYFRSGGNGPCSNRITLKIDYDYMGVELKKFIDVNGISREYLVYVPKSCRGSRKKIPLVLALHGISESIRNYFEASQWYLKAEKEEFMVVMPESTLLELPPQVSEGKAKAYRTAWQIEHPDMRYTDIAFINELLDRIIAEYQIDESRIYCTGHSMGCMMTNYLGSEPICERFTALGATSGIMSVQGTERTQIVPIFLTMGQYDLWDYSITSDGVLVNTLDTWLIRDELATEENVHQIRTGDEVEHYRNGNFHHYIWKNKNGIPLVRYAWILRKEHMNTPEENFLLWDEWFSKWEKNEAGERCFEGRING